MSSRCSSRQMFSVPLIFSASKRRQHCPTSVFPNESPYYLRNGLILIIISQQTVPYNTSSHAPGRYKRFFRVRSIYSRNPLGKTDIVILKDRSSIVQSGSHPPDQTRWIHKCLRYSGSFSCFPHSPARRL